MRTVKKPVAVLLSITLLLGLFIPAQAVSQTGLEEATVLAAAHIYKTVADPQIGSIGGEWVILGLARSSYPVPTSCFQRYYETVEADVTACNGVLSERKYTEYARVVLALTAIGKDPSNVGGYNLLTPLGDFDQTVHQGINGAFWALIALNSGSYAIPQNTDAATQATRALYVAEVLERQLADGGWSLSGTTPSDPDTTAMALTALSNYMADPTVSQAVGRAVTLLSELQRADGGYASAGVATTESTVQVVVALSALGIDPDDDRFTKNGNTVLDALLDVQQQDGSFPHLTGEAASNQMASEQGLYGLVAAWRAVTGQNSLYCMSDAEPIGDSEESAETTGLSGKHQDVQAVPITAPGTTFPDLTNCTCGTAVEALAARGIINGMGDGTFAPEQSMTRAQFAAIVVRALGVTPQSDGAFLDVPQSEWYAAYVDTAHAYGIVNGVGDGLFVPQGTITRQEAAVMVTRAAELCGMDIDLTQTETRDILAPFGDYVTVAEWAQPAVAFCYQQGFLDQSALQIEPEKAVLRGEIAQMLFLLLTAANLI